MAAAEQGPPPTGLPVEDIMAPLRDALADGAAVLEAAPGAGKTTVVPLRLLGEGWRGDGRIVVLEPRRVAARAAAARMAALLGEEVGRTVGYTTRDDRRGGAATRVEVVTEGILTRRLQADPSLPGVALVVFDEIHERNLEADLALALTLDVRSGLRPDLRILAMSATLDAGPVASFLGGVPVITSAGRSFPVELRWAPAGSGARLVPAVAGAVKEALRRETGDLLVFLPGVGEIRGVASALGRLAGVDVLPLHGGVPAAEQDRALRAGPHRRAVLATDLAETSVTVEGVSVVVDAGLARRPRYDPSTGLTRLRTVVAPRASADQRSGRAGRLGPGVAYRLWSQAEHAARRPWGEPEILNRDLAGLALELAVWGAAPTDLRWLDPPPAAAMAAGSQLLEELGALRGGRPTKLGRKLAGLPLHPRLGAMLLQAPDGRRRTAALLAALISERDILRSDGSPATVDVAARLSVLNRESRLPATVDPGAVATVQRRADELLRRSGGVPSARHVPDAAELGALLATAYPDRIAQARGPGRYRLRHGGGAVLPAHDPLVGAAWLVAADVDGAAGGPGLADGRIRLAAEVDRAEVERIGGDAVRTRTRLEWDRAADDLREVTERTLDGLVLDTSRRPAGPGPSATEALVAHALDTGLAVLGWGPASRALQARATWARRVLGDDWPDVSDAALVASARDWLSVSLHRATSRADLARMDPSVAIRAALGSKYRLLDRLLPATIEVAGGRRVPVDYRAERPRISVRVQGLYGTSIHPSVAEGRVPVTVELLSPAGRPIQITSDLPAFWRGSWRQVRKEMAGRYPRHSWPEDPAASPPNRSNRRG